MKTKLFSFFVALFATTALWAYDFKSGDLYYNITSSSDKTVEVTSSIDDGNFFDGVNYEGLISADIPSSVAYNGITYSVTNIGNRAFSRCPDLTSIIIPNSVTSIGDAAFRRSTNLTNITIPNSVTSIGDDAFDVTPWYEGKSNGVVYINKLLYKYKGEMPDNTSIVVKDGTIGICYFAFGGCGGLTSITIPNSVTNIGDNAFAGCTGLMSIVIPNGVTSIGSCVFVDCSGLISITIQIV